MRLRQAPDAFGRETMKATRSMIALVVGLGLLMLVSGLGAQQTPTSSKLQRTDRNFITKAAAGGRAEVELGRLAQGKASSDVVKQFGLRMVEDHGAANQELMQLAENKGMPKQDVAEFRRMHSGAVDPNLKAWVDKTLPTLEDHLKTIEGIQAQMAKK